MPAQLIPEPKNKYDRNAIKVICAGHHVGYLAREHAAQYAPVLTALIDQGWTPQVEARVWTREFEDWENPRKTACHLGLLIRKVTR
ncbi:MAG TPA: HIRAN domain-containing protein [Micromonospora sp.]